VVALLFLLLYLLLVELAVPLVVSLAEVGSATKLLPAALDLIHETHLAQLLNYLLVCSLLLGHLLLFDLLLTFEGLALTGAPFMLLHLLEEETTLHAPTATVLASTVLEQKTAKLKVLPFSGLGTHN